MTPAEYNAHAKAWRNRERRKQSRFAMLAVVAAQCAGNKDSSTEDFMGAFGEDTE